MKQALNKGGGIIELMGFFVEHFREADFSEWGGKFIVSTPRKVSMRMKT